MGDRIAGVAYVKADGVSLSIKGSCTIEVGGGIREGIAGQDGVHGYKEMPRGPAITMTASTVRGGSIEDLQGMTNATVTLEAANGTVWVLARAWQAGEVDVNTEEGEYTLRFEGMSLRELAENV